MSKSGARIYLEECRQKLAQLIRQREEAQRIVDQNLRERESLLKRKTDAEDKINGRFVRPVRTGEEQRHWERQKIRAYNELRIINMRLEQLTQSVIPPVVSARDNYDTAILQLRRTIDLLESMFAMFESSPDTSPGDSPGEDDDDDDPLEGPSGTRGYTKNGVGLK